MIQKSGEAGSAPSELNKDRTVRQATVRDINSMCALFASTFETYPFPIHERSYLQKAMDDGIVFFVVETGEKIIACGSCEKDMYGLAAEMSDLAVDGQYQGLGLSKILLSQMEEQMAEDGIKTAFTICRALPVPVNRLFGGAGYRYGGTLIKNTNICGTFESMNVWFKQIT